ncbi:pteridine reductase [Solimonas sp. SE-A11]|uniref:pteridine reductase n=1 Tax=Solimonas sp. SE-A11 TaxID=3054954 RepID=UPI00259D251F|nr:pteridine reductase [Solimonas sp. SE-A11]MDM4771822.1 pteridine reductase [Solimonas sp. SE-A11]
MAMSPVILVTGAARRVGAAIVREMHAAGWSVVIHANRSFEEAWALAMTLNQARPDSAQALQADLLDPAALEKLAQAAHECWGRLDALVNNASTWYPTPVGELTAAAFEDLVGSNLRAPLLLTQACAARMEQGAVVNIIDVHARRPQRGYSAYTAAKAGLWAVTESLALELSPRIRVNGVAPGHMIWPEAGSLNKLQQHAELARVPMARLGGGEEIARAVKFLLSPEAAYITGAVLPVDGGLRLG